MRKSSSLTVASLVALIIITVMAAGVEPSSASSSEVALGSCVVCWEGSPPCISNDEHTTYDWQEMQEGVDHDGDCVPGGDCDIEHPYCIGGGGNELMFALVSAWEDADTQAMRTILAEHDQSFFVDAERASVQLLGTCAGGVVVGTLPVEPTVLEILLEAQ